MRLMICLLVFFLMVITAEASTLWVNYEDNTYRDDVVLYATDYMFVISQNREIAPVILQDTVKDPVKKPLISIMVTTDTESVNEGLQKPADLPEQKVFTSKETEKSSGSEYTVYFNFDSAKLRNDQINVLNDIQLKGGEKASVYVNVLNDIQLKGGEKASVYGYACPIGKAGYNKKLSEKRAKAVADYLQRRGVTIGEVIGMGETDEAKDLKLNRKAVVKFQ